MQLQRHEKGTDELNKLSDKIQSGARAFLTTEYKYISMFAFLAFTALLIIYTLEPPTGADDGDRLDGIRAGGCFLAGAVLSASAGWAGKSCHIYLEQSFLPRGLYASNRCSS